ncbi:glycosyltransferase family 2 protein [Demequina sp. NBRC 110052]|uniref:glycosyltransferase family 2 protein n=1 Tax=Demequina sp. NBRC 110052 TaxID=1570341 RepID=UPI000A04869F|nr:glycosyltransferase family 2 protein [Demequina sp. NBRC 110052]
MARDLIPVTVLVQTKNEENAIRLCLEGLEDFDQVIVVDSDSTDATKEIARGCGATVVNFTWDGQYPKKKQWQLENVRTRNDWILFIDSDEFPSERLVEDIRVFVEKSGSFAAASVELDYYFAGRMLRFGHRVSKTILLRRGHAWFEPVDDLDVPGMGELEGHYQPKCDGPVARLGGRLRHEDVDPVSTWFARHNRYSDWEAHVGARARRSDAVYSNRSAQGRAFARAPFKPVAFFIYSYVVRLGFLDGRAGFDYAFALAAYYWQIGLKRREIDRLARLEG